MFNKTLAGAMALALLPTSLAGTAHAEVPAKKLFGAREDAAAMRPAVYGSYARGCVAGAARLPDDGPTWQAMRLSRNRHWAHPSAVELVKRLSRDGRGIGWNGLLVGDLTQPRGGPMLSGHASHQAGLDADIWLTPMPDRRLTREERETLSATSMLARRDGKLTNLEIDKQRFTDAHAALIRTAAEYPEIERIFVHPTIKREMCERHPNRPPWLSKVRAQWKHHYHMHLRLKCPVDSPGCKPQRAVPNDGCGKNLDWWFNVAYAPRKKPDPAKAKPKVKVTKKSKPKRKGEITLAGLPKACQSVLHANGHDGLSQTRVSFTVPIERPAGSETITVSDRKDAAADARAIMRPPAAVPSTVLPYAQPTADPFAMEAIINGATSD